MITTIFTTNFTKNEKRQLWVRPNGGWNSTLQAAWYVRHAHWACLCYVPIEIWCLWITSTIWLLIPLVLSFTSFMVGRSRVLYIHSSWKIQVGDSPGCYQGEQDDFTRMTSVHNHSVHGYYITRMERGVTYAWYCYMLHKIKQNQVEQKRSSMYNKL